MGWDGERISPLQAWAEENGLWGSRPRSREENSLHRASIEQGEHPPVKGCRCDSCGQIRTARRHAPRLTHEPVEPEHTKETCGHCFICVMETRGEPVSIRINREDDET